MYLQIFHSRIVKFKKMISECLGVSIDSLELKVSVKKKKSNFLMKEQIWNGKRQAENKSFMSTVLKDLCLLLSSQTACF